MPLPKLSPLQSRLAASFAASVIVFLLYLALFSGHFAYALDVDSATGDYAHDGLYWLIKSEDMEDEEILDSRIPSQTADEPSDLRTALYEAQFLGLDRSIIGRAEPVPLDLKNNVAEKINIGLGQTVYRKVLNTTLWGPLTPPSSDFPAQINARRSSGTWSDNLSERQSASRTLYITLNTCLQPSNINGLPPQVELYVSQTEQNPGPDKSLNAQVKQVATGGYANISFPASGDVYIGIFAPNATTTTLATGQYSVEVGASIDGPYHSCNTDYPFLFFIDSDADSVLLATESLTNSTNGTLFDQWMHIKPPFDVFANNHSNPLLAGVQNSFCGLQMISQIADPSKVETSITDKTFGSFPKQQFFFRGLATNSSYSGTLAFNNHSQTARPGVVGGGGTVWQKMDFVTQAFPSQTSVNCELIFNLSFCDSVAYAVPSNPSNFPNATVLATFYDNMARSAYTNFDYALQQIPCEIPSTGKYSLARTCDDCANAYKDWLCSVTIPRCMPFGSPEPWLQPRNMAQAFPDNTTLSADVLGTAASVLYLNSSRNPSIDQVVQPGPYKEILPCNDLCYNLVQSCPAAMGFACPVPGQMGFEYSYGLRPTAGQEGQLTCNYPGAAYALSSAEVHRIPFLRLTILVSFLGIVLAW